MDCKTAITLLEPYLDAELDRSDARELEAHVDGCADCRAALTQLGELRQSLRDPSLRHAAPPALRERLMADRTRSRRALPQWTRLAAACVLAFGAGGLSLHLWNSAQPAAAAQAQLARDLFAGHWRALAAASPVDVVSSDRHTVKPWFEGKVAQSPLVRDFTEQGFTLVGGRLDYAGEARVAVLVYRHGRHLIDVYVLPAAAAIPSPVRQQGYVIAPVMLGGQPAAIVSDTDAQELARFAALLSTAQ